MEEMDLLKLSIGKVEPQHASEIDTAKDTGAAEMA